LNDQGIDRRREEQYSDLVLVLLTCGEHIIILIVNILALVLGEGESGAQEGS